MNHFPLSVSKISESYRNVRNVSGPVQRLLPMFIAIFSDEILTVRNLKEIGLCLLLSYINNLCQAFTNIFLAPEMLS